MLTSPHKKIIFAGIGIAFFLFLIFFYEHTKLEQEVFFQRALEDFVVPEITIDGTVYTFSEEELQNGALSKEELSALRLAYFALAVRLQPQYALPSVDLEQYNKAVGELIRSRGRIAQQYDNETAALIDKHLYPISFLTLLGNLELERRSFIEQPTIEQAESYQSLLTSTIDAYQEHITGFISALDTVESAKLSGKSIRFHGGTSDTVYMRNVYRALLEESNTLMILAQERFSCFEGKVSYCQNLELPKLPIRDGISKTDIRVLPEEVQKHSELVSRMRMAPYEGFVQEKEIAVLSDTACFRQYQPAYYHLWSRAGNSGVPVVRFDIVNDILLYDMKDGKQSKWRYAERFIRDGGGPYLFQPIATHYICPELVSDQSVIQTLLFALRNPVIFPDGIIDEKLVEQMFSIYARYDDFSNSSLLTEALFDRYVSSLADLFRSRTPRELAELTSIEFVHSLEQFLLTVQYGTYRYEEILMGAVSSNDAVPQYAHHGTGTSIEELFFIRAFPKTLLSGFNPSISPQNISYVERSVSTLPESGIRYADVQDKYSLNEWVHMLQNSISVEVNLGREAGVEYQTIE